MKAENAEINKASAKNQQQNLGLLVTNALNTENSL